MDLLQTNITIKSPQSDLQRLINCHKLLRYNLQSSEVTVEAELSRADIYTKHYLDGVQLGKNLAVTDLQPADDLAILAGHVFVNLWTMTNEEKYLYNAASLLEYAVTRSKPSFRIRLMLIRIYRLLGEMSTTVEERYSLENRCSRSGDRTLSSNANKADTKRYPVPFPSFSIISLLTSSHW